MIKCPTENRDSSSLGGVEQDITNMNFQLERNQEIGVTHTKLSN